MTKHIQAYFKEWNDAEAAGYDLRALGATDITSDRAADRNFGLESRTGNVNPPVNLVSDPISRMPTSYSIGMTENPGWVSLNNSGADNGPEDIDAAGVGIPVLSAKIEDSLYDQAMDIVKKHSGTLQFPGGEE